MKRIFTFAVLAAFIVSSGFMFSACTDEGIIFGQEEDSPPSIGVPGGGDGGLNNPGGGNGDGGGDNGDGNGNGGTDSGDGNGGTYTGSILGDWTAFNDPIQYSFYFSESKYQYKQYWNSGDMKTGTYGYNNSQLILHQIPEGTDTTLFCSLIENDPLNAYDDKLIINGVTYDKVPPPVMNRIR
jgi:hypothetical protein